MIMGSATKDDGVAVASLTPKKSFRHMVSLMNQVSEFQTTPYSKTRVSSHRDGLKTCERLAPTPISPAEVGEARKGKRRLPSPKHTAVSLKKCRVKP